MKGMPQTCMTFDHGQFVLRLGSERTFKSEQLDGWVQVDDGIYKSANLQSAARFRGFATQTCNYVFNQIFNELTEAPFFPDLSFLDPHQLEGVTWILTRKRSYLAHAPGAGKTAEAIVASRIDPGPGKTIFIVPPTLVKNWEQEILKFTRLFTRVPRVGIIQTTRFRSTVSWKSDILIVPDSMLATPWVYAGLMHFDIKFLAVDEASRFKEPTSNRTVALFGGRARNKSYGGLTKRAGRVVLLDGSPMPNRPMELWAPVYALDPEAIDCMNQRDFGFRYCGAKLNQRGVWEFNHSSNEAELAYRLRKRFMHVVTEDQLSHPERRRSIFFLDGNLKSPAMYKWERKNLNAISKKIEAMGIVSETLSQGEIAAYRKELGIRKIAPAIKYILSRLQTNKEEKLLVFAWHREVCLSLCQELKRFTMVELVYGGTEDAEREKTFMSFQTGGLRVIVGNIAAMGRGHNLQRADRVIFVEASWSDELNKQCEKRASRRGRDEAAFVRCEYLVAPDSLDERIMRSLFSKQSRVKSIIG